MLGMHGSAYANYAVQECDCLIAVGARFDDRVTGNLATFAPHAKIIHIDIDPASISKNVQVDIPVVGDAKDILREMLEYIEPRDRVGLARRRSPSGRSSTRFRYDAAPARSSRRRSSRPLGEMTDHDAIVATGVGQHQMWAAQFYGWRRPRQIITSGGLGTMGFGCPAAIGAQFGNPGKTVIDIDGDGSFSMTMVEVITAVQLRAAGQVRRAGQRLPGHGPPVAGAVLRPPVLRRGAPVPGLRRGGRGLRRPRHDACPTAAELRRRRRRDAQARGPGRAGRARSSRKRTSTPWSPPARASTKWTSADLAEHGVTADPSRLSSRRWMAVCPDSHTDLTPRPADRDTAEKAMKHVISALVQNQPGVLAHVAGMFAARGFNIDSLVVGRTEDPDLSRMTIVVIGDDRVAGAGPQAARQDRRRWSRSATSRTSSYVERDLMLIRVHAPPEKRPRWSTWSTCSAAGSSTSPARASSMELSGHRG